MTNNFRVVITPGEPAGIGPDITVLIAQQNWPMEIVVCASPTLLYQRAEKLGIPLILRDYQYQSTTFRSHKAGMLTVLPIKMPHAVQPGILCTTNSQYVINTLTRACNGCINGEFAGLITGPVHKGIINNAGIKFIGHTEFFANHTGSHRVVMMLVKKKLRIALATTHLPLIDVPNAISSISLHEIITILHYNLKKQFNISQPNIFVCGLNPHAGENGYIGTEEINVIIPILNKLRKKGIKLIGPLPADTLFQHKYLKFADVILTMYHDQGLPVLKYKGFNDIVNITLGLPFIRTSVGHGTALELSGTGKAKPNSLIAAINLALHILKNNNE